MTRRRWIYPGGGAEPIEVTADYLQAQAEAGATSLSLPRRR